MLPFTKVGGNEAPFSLSLVPPLFGTPRGQVQDSRQAAAMRISFTHIPNLKLEKD